MGVREGAVRWAGCDGLSRRREARGEYGERTSFGRRRRGPVPPSSPLRSRTVSLGTIAPDGFSSEWKRDTGVVVTSLKSPNVKGVDGLLKDGRFVANVSGGDGPWEETECRKDVRD